MHVYLKFNEGTAATARQRVVRLIRRRGATSVYRLFPRATDRDRASRFVAEVAGEADARAIVRWLGVLPEVEYAERQVERGPR